MEFGLGGGGVTEWKRIEARKFNWDVGGGRIVLAGVWLKGILLLHCVIYIYTYIYLGRGDLAGSSYGLG